MQHLEVSGAVRPIYGSLGVKRLSKRNSFRGKQKALRYVWYMNISKAYWTRYGLIYSGLESQLR